MRVKELKTKEGDGVLTVLKGGKHATSSMAVGPQLRSSAETSVHNWGRPACGIGNSAENLNVENGSRSLDDTRSKSYQQEGKVICGNPSFLSRFIEFRINGNELCVKMTPGTGNSIEQPGSRKVPDISVSAQSACNKINVGSKSSPRVADALDTEIVSAYQFRNNAREIAKTLSQPDCDKGGNENSLSERAGVNPDVDRVIGDADRVLCNISAVGRVEELRIRIEGQVENTGNGVRENVSAGVKGYKDQSFAPKSAADAKEDGMKTDRRSSASTRDNTPRKVSFRVRGSSNNGRLSSHISSTASRRSSTLSKALFADARLPKLSSTKVAALASKFNAIIHENKGVRSDEVIHNDSKKKLPISQLTTGLTTGTIKKPPAAEKLFTSRRNSSNSKRENSLSNSGGVASSTSVGVALRKQSFVKEPLAETDSVHKSSSTKDYRRRNNMAYRHSAAATTSGCVKAAIQIFENNASISPSTKNSAVVSEEKKKVSVSCSTVESKQPLESAEAKKEPKYHRVIFKRDATLVRVTLDCEDVCNGDETSKQGEGNMNIQWQKSTPKLLTNNCDEEREKICVKKDGDLKSCSVKGKSDKNVLIVSVKEGARQNKTERNQTKCRPTVPAKNVNQEQSHRSVPFSKHKTDDSNHMTVTCKPASICGATSNAVMAENTLVRQDKLGGPQNSSAVSECAVKTPHPIQEKENSQQREKESVAPNRSFLWGASVPGTNQSTSLPGINQSTSVPSTNQSTSLLGTNQSTLQGTSQSTPVPGTNQSTSLTCTSQSTPIPGTNHSTSILSTNQSTSVPGTSQSTSVPGTNHSTSILSTNQSTSVPAVVANGYESAKPDDSAGLTVDSADDTYDDVYPPSPLCSYNTSSNHPYSVVQPQDDDVYDDVGPPTSEKELQRARAPAFAVSISNDADRAYEYCQAPLESPLDQNYDDCEGEGYQCIGEDTESNIYDDVKSEMTLRMPDDGTSISNCYESIYSGGDRLITADGRTSVASGTMRTGASSSASSSIGNHSCCDQSNSLYGVGGSRFDSASVSQASTVSADYGTHEVLSYQLTRMGSGQPRSETSDEWVDVEMTDSDGEEGEDAVAVYQGRPRSRKSPRRSRKARKQWSKPLRKAAGSLANGDHSSDSDGDHHYEMLYEVVGDVKNEPVPYDDFDSFDSDVSDETYIKPLHQADCDVANGRLPEPPPGQNIYGISKIAEAAGKKMLKLGKSLRKIRTKRSSNDAGVQHKACPPLPTSPRPSPPSPPSLSSPPVLPPRISEKSVSSGNLSGRKYWSLRKFKRSVSASEQTSLMSLTGGSKKETATFYLTQAMDADTGSIEGSTNRLSTDAADVCSENGDLPTSPSSLGSNKTVIYDTGFEANYSSEGLQKSVTNATGARKQRSASTPERRNSGNIRPNSPPPLPPHSSGSSDNAKKPPRKEKRSSSNTSWYAECGLFDQTTDVQNVGVTDTPKRNVKKQDKPTSNSWYAEVGLWEMSTSSANDSSVSEQDARSQHTDLSGGDSPLTAGSPENSGVIERRFADEPLYQFYTAAVVERDMRSELDSDGYEEVGDGSRKPKPLRPTAMELIQPREGQHRTLWCEIPEVVSSAILSTISPHQKKLQEAKFEIITSEASYINSLNVLEKHFISSLEMCDESVLSKNDRRILFSNLIPVKTCSENFLAELEECWQDNILLNGICEVVYKHASNNFNAYVKYCSNQICLDRSLRGLKEQNTKFAEVLLQLESNPMCQSLSLHSFLMLPMQRITRLPLLVDAVLTRLDQSDDEYSMCQLALATLNKIVQNCNEDARRMERMEEILILSPQLYFPSEVKAIPIISSTRWLVRKGELTHLVWRGDEGKLTFGKKFCRIQIHMFLFTDLLVITKRKRKSTPDATGDECYAVMDYCPRNLVQMTSTEGMTNLPVKFTSDGGRNLVLLTMLQNHEKKTVEMVLSCSTESDRQRWLEAVSPPVSDNPDETVYEEWDCPQVMAIHPYVACQPDELSLEVADVVNVLRKMSDGWYQGERIRDSERGWFPGNHTSEVVSAHVRARNLKQRYRLLALSGNFLEAQRKEKQAK